MNVPIPGPATLHREARALGQVPDFGLSLAPFAWLVIAQGLKGVLNDPFAPPLVRAVAWLTLKGVAARACPAGSLAAALFDVPRPEGCGEVFALLEREARGQG